MERLLRSIDACIAHRGGGPHPDRASIVGVAGSRRGAPRNERALNGTVETILPHGRRC